MEVKENRAETIRSNGLCAGIIMFFYISIIALYSTVEPNLGYLCLLIFIPALIMYRNWRRALKLPEQDLIPHFKIHLDTRGPIFRVITELEEREQEISSEMTFTVSRMRKEGEAGFEYSLSIMNGYELILEVVRCGSKMALLHLEHWFKTGEISYYHDETKKHEVARMEKFPLGD